MFKKILCLSLISFFAFSGFCSLSPLFDDYFESSYKCLQAFDENYRETCMWGSIETLKKNLNTFETIKKSSFKVYYCGFFRNEGIRILSINDPFSIPKNGEYFLTVLNGNPRDKRSRAKMLRILLHNDKTSEKILEETNFSKEEKTIRKIQLESGINYSLQIEQIEPIPSYITVLVSDNPVE